jgi:hypothetical protein
MLHGCTAEKHAMTWKHITAKVLITQITITLPDPDASLHALHVLFTCYQNSLRLSRPLYSMGRRYRWQGLTRWLSRWWGLGERPCAHPQYDEPHREYQRFACWWWYKSLAHAGQAEKSEHVDNTV